MARVSIVNIDKAALLAALYNASKPQGMGFMHFDPTPMSIEEASALLKEGTYFDYLKGRIMKVDISGDELETWGYNRDVGTDAAEKVIQILRDSAETNSDEIQTMHAEGIRQAADDATKLMEEPTYTEGSTFHMGLAEMAPHLRPAVERAMAK